MYLFILNLCLLTKVEKNCLGYGFSTTIEDELVESHFFCAVWIDLTFGVDQPNKDIDLTEKEDRSTSKES